VRAATFRPAIATDYAGTFETGLFCSLCDRLDRRGEQS
jgi:hypothetical protein